MFVISKLAGAVLMPLSLLVLAGIVGLVLLFTRYGRWGRGVLIVTVAALYLASWEPTASRLLAPLEQRYPALLDPAGIAEGEEAPVTDIVVLGHGHRLDPQLPVTAQANADGVTRVLEGVRLQRHFPQSTLWLTGGAVRGDTPNSAVLHRLMGEVGLDAGAVERLAEPRNTAEEARAMAERLGDEAGSIILVTEASHMPRAMGLFRGQGLKPIPAPTRHRVREREPGAEAHPGHGLRPSVHALHMTERAFHEYLGIAWGRIRGEIRAAER
ncbi:MAG: YdcF family protein [Halorhodospira halophila]|uniref:ElyC/SanA/YdcF family protein n=1 Tax=Halorhodospira TaxID=85108 RepID=UPI001EE7BA12|nr:ElyC/SanA/YdcF family protein [Halorhodospira halophila]MCG5532494.1 YdcF family protein [Halorhodospira sp. 9621]MCG5538148.1 YdcF family protein [Halorhodospira sp. 9622]MCG5543377.1 YdcF family protein [Halorhodospira sp. 9628]MCC3751618.1 YdcF family protein [Halorhodospira halophila]MCG5527279.1 YdcF family protein [Halorhodospira halophila]